MRHNMHFKHNPPDKYRSSERGRSGCDTRIAHNHGDKQQLGIRGFVHIKLDYHHKYGNDNIRRIMYGCWRRTPSSGNDGDTRQGSFEHHHRSSPIGLFGQR